jgi:hypothetical protein
MKLCKKLSVATLLTLFSFHWCAAILSDIQNTLPYLNVPT